MIHSTVIGNTPPGTWDHITNLLIPTTSTQFAVSQTSPPPGVPPSRWCQRFGWNHGWDLAGGVYPNDPINRGNLAGYYLAEDVIRALTTGFGGSPRAERVVIDEIKPNDGSGAYQACYYASWWLSERQRTNLPEIRGRWGFFVPNTSSVPWNTIWGALYYALIAHAYLACQFYYNIETYRGIRRDFGVASADQRLREYFLTPYGYGYAWLANAAISYQSPSRLHPIIGVFDGAMNFIQNNAAGPQQFIDRMMWAFKTCGDYYSPPIPYGDNAHEVNGGIGSWKWHRDPMSDFYSVLSPDRDGYFVDSWNYYLRGATWAERRTPRWTVP